MSITSILQKDSISIGMDIDDKFDLLKNMVYLASKSGKINDNEIAINKVFEREKIMSTGVGKGIALPHAKTDVVVDSVGALAILRNDIDFDSIDGKPVKLVFLLLGQEQNVGNHLRLLSKISRILNNDSFRNKIINSQNQEEILLLFEEIEQEI